MNNSDDQGIEFHTTVTAEQEWLEDEEAQKDYLIFLAERNAERRREAMQTAKENGEIDDGQE